MHSANYIILTGSIIGAGRQVFRGFLYSPFLVLPTTHGSLRSLALTSDVLSALSHTGSRLSGLGDHPPHPSLRCQPRQYPPFILTRRAGRQVLEASPHHPSSRIIHPHTEGRSSGVRGQFSSPFLALTVMRQAFGPLIH